MADEGAELTWDKVVMLIFVAISFIVLFVILALAFYMPSLRS